jgi:23S rRNA pseudouridine1911/1915/1917 synthase
VKRPPSRLRLAGDREEPLLALVVRRGGIGESAAREAIQRGGAFVRGRRVREIDSAIRPGDRVELTLHAPQPAALTRAHLLHLDDLVMVVDKPAGVAAQEDLAGGPALAELCGALLRELGERETAALLVHRLDRGTTGVTVLARTRRAQTALLLEFREHRVEKDYRALVAPAPAQESGTVEEPVSGKSALTRWEVLERYRDAALVRALPRTGRTHQIRLHLGALGCPLLGDKAHGGPALMTRPSGSRHDFARPMLHAFSLSLRHPAGGDLRAQAKLPEDFEAAAAFLRR